MPWRSAREPAVWRRSWKRTSAGRPAFRRRRLNERVTESARRILPFMLGKTRPGSSQTFAATRSLRWRARWALRTSAVRGPIRTRRSWPVLVVVTRTVEVLVFAERRTASADLGPVSSTSSHRKAASADMKPEQLATNPSELRHWILELIRYERLIVGEPETIEVCSEKIELQATIEEKLKSYVPVFQELLNEGAIRLDGYHDQPMRER